MAVLAVTYTLSNGQTSDATLWNTNYSDIVTWLNNRYNGTDTWLNVKISATAMNPVDVSGSGASTELSINNSATDGDPLLTFKLSGTQTHVIGVDDSDSDFLKFATTGLTTNVAMQIATTGAGIQTATGTSGTALGICGIGDTNTGFWWVAADQLSLVVGGSSAIDATSAAVTLYVGGNPAVLVNATEFRPNTDNNLNLGTAAKRWKEVFAIAGTINTSHSSTKTDIHILEDFKIPPGVMFNRGERKYVGYLNDILQDEARPIDENGSIIKEMNYESAVTGNLCAGWWDHNRRIEKLEALLNA